MTFDFFLDPFLEIRKLKSDIEELKAWRSHTADPNINANINNITNIANNIQNNIYPSIQKAQEDILKAQSEINENKNITVEAKESALNAVNLSNNALSEVRNIQDNVSNIANDIEIAKTSAMDAVNQVRDMSNRFIDAADGVVADMNNLKTASETFITALKTVFGGEDSSITKQFKLFGANIYANSEVIKTAVVGLVTEIKEMIDQTGKPLGDIDEYLKRAQVKGDEIYIPFNLGMAISLLASRYMVRWMQTIGGAAPENPTLYNWYDRSSHGAVMEEIFEGFDELTVEFGKLGSSFVQFGTMTQDDANDLYNLILYDLNIVEIAFNDFVNAFNLVFVNLSKRLKGEQVG